MELQLETYWVERRETKFDSLLITSHFGYSRSHDTEGGEVDKAQEPCGLDLPQICHKFLGYAPSQLDVE